jgi:hypothetical protein
MILALTLAVMTAALFYSWRQSRQSLAPVVPDGYSATVLPVNMDRHPGEKDGWYCINLTEPARKFCVVRTSGALAVAPPALQPAATWSSSVNLALTGIGALGTLLAGVAAVVPRRKPRGPDLSDKYAN